MKNHSGMTLLELMIVMAILSIVMGMLYLLALNLQLAATAQDDRITTQDDVRSAMEYIARELRQASNTSINWAALPGPTIQYQRAEDIDGNGLAVNSQVNLELSPVRIIQQDTGDLNHDKLTNTQLVMIQGNTVHVITNGLVPVVGSAGSATRGIWFQPGGNGVRVTIQARRRSGPREQPQTSQLSEVIVPRN